MPGWVKVFIAVGVVLLLALVVAELLGVRHGPDLHGPTDAPAEHVPPVDHGP